MYHVAPAKQSVLVSQVAQLQVLQIFAEYRICGLRFCWFFFQFFKAGNTYSSHKVTPFQENTMERFRHHANLPSFNLILVGICFRSF